MTPFKGCEKEGKHCTDLEKDEELVEGSNKKKHRYKVNITLEEAMKVRRGRYSSTLSLTSALDAVTGQRHDPAALPPEKKTGNYYTAGWVCPWASIDTRSMWKTVPAPGFDARTVQPVASSYTD